MKMMLSISILLLSFVVQAKVDVPKVVSRKIATIADGKVLCSLTNGDRVLAKDEELKITSNGDEKVGAIEVSQDGKITPVNWNSDPKDLQAAVKRIGSTFVFIIQGREMTEVGFLHIDGKKKIKVEGHSVFPDFGIQAFGTITPTSSLGVYDPNQNLLANCSLK